MTKVRFCLIGILFSSPALAQVVDESTPKNQTRTAAVGGVVWEHAKFSGAPGVIVEQPVQAQFTFGQSVDLPAGSTFMIIREKKLKACHERTVSRLGGYSIGGWSYCLIDTNDDGSFERLAVNEVAKAKDVVPPIKYTKQLVPIGGVGSASFRKVITYLGKSGDDIRLSYREFANDMARPAFTEDLTLAVPEQFPQSMQVKDVKLTVLGIGPSGLSYRID